MSPVQDSVSCLWLKISTQNPGIPSIAPSKVEFEMLGFQEIAEDCSLGHNVKKAILVACLK
jgi:hypothetical protein